MGTLINGISGQEVAKRTFGKTDLRYWHQVIFKPTYKKDGRTVEVDHWSVRIQWRGRRELFSLNTSNKTAAAAKAKEIYALLIGAGWDAALAKYKPSVVRRPLLTV